VSGRGATIVAVNASRERVLREVLGVSAAEVSPAWIVDLAGRSLGAARARRAVELVRTAPLCKRGDLLADLVALSVGTSILGEQWWSLPTPARLLEVPPTGHTPDEYLAGHPVREVTFGPIDYLALLVAEAAAAPTTHSADLNFPVYTGVVPVPDGAVPGDRFPRLRDRVPGAVQNLLMGDEHTEVGQLVLDGASGLWEVTSSGPTRYVVDLDARPPLCMRVPGPGTRSRGATDHRWAPVVRVRSIAEDGTATSGVLRVGERPAWDLDNGDEIVWWVQRLATAIRALPRDEMPAAADERTGERGPTP
jgi:hypothetical protein